MTKEHPVRYAILLLIPLILIGVILMHLRSTPDETVKIGVLVSETGPLAAWGQAALIGMHIAVDEANQLPGGPDFVLVIEDTQNDPKRIAAGAQKLITVDKVTAIIADTSTATLTAAPIAEASHVPLIGFLSSSPDISNAGDYIFRTSPSNVENMKILAESVMNAGYSRVGVIVEAKDYPLGNKKMFEGSFKKLGGNVVAEDSFETSSTDVRTQLTKINAAQPEALIVFTQSPVAGAMVLKQTVELGIKFPLFGNEGVANSETVRLAGYLANGIVFVEPDFDLQAGKAKELREKYEAQTSAAPPQWVYVATAYDSFSVLAEAVRTVGTNTEKVKDYLYGVKDRSGASGKLSFDRNGDPVFKFTLKTIKDGKIVRFK